MTIKRRRQNDELLELLRRGDPAAGDRGLGAEETARLRRRVVSEASASKTPAFRPIPALAVLTVLVATSIARSSPRTVLVETFGSVDCDDCRDARFALGSLELAAQAATSRDVTHIDFLAVDPNLTVQVDVPLVLVDRVVP